MQQFYLKKGKYIVNCSIKIKHILTTPFLICLTFLLFSQKTSAQTTTLDFEEYKNGNVVLGKTFDYEGFRFAINLQGLGQIVTRTNKGYNNTAALYDDNNVAGGITRYTISKIDGAEFQFRSIYLDNPTRWADSTGYIQGFRDGVAIGNPKYMEFNSEHVGLKDFTSDPNFYNIDEIQITANDINFYLDHLTYGPPLIVPVLSVSSIYVDGVPGLLAREVDFRVTFNESVTGVSTDDFSLTTTGSAVGEILSVSGSGSTYTIRVNNVSGDGTLRLDLKANTNITSSASTGSIPAFTTGEVHTTSSCAFETFEAASFSHGATSFSSNGMTFALTGFKVNRKVGFGSPVSGNQGYSDVYLTNDLNPGTFFITSSQLFSMNTMDLFVSDADSDSHPTDVGKVVIVGKRNGVPIYTITKTDGFPTNFENYGGFFRIDFATAGLGNFRNANIDRLEITISDGFREVLIDNFSFCREVADNDPPSGHSVAFDQSNLNTSNADSVSFTITNGELAAYYSYTISSSGGGQGLGDSGWISGASHQHDGIDLSWMTDGTLTLTLRILDFNGNWSDPVTTQIIKNGNEAPVITVPGTQSFVKNTNRVFSLANGNAISVSDSDIGSAPIKITLRATNGVITLSTISGLIFEIGTGEIDSEMVFLGTLTAVNTALEGLTYTPNADFVGSASLEIISNDQGNSGVGGALEDSETIAITVLPTAPQILSVNADKADGTYGIGTPIVIAVVFDQPVVVSTAGDVPSLELETGIIDALAVYSHSSQDTVYFNYVVQENNFSASLDYTTVTALSLEGGTIKNVYDVDAVLTLPSPGAANSLSANKDLKIDGVRPTATISLFKSALIVGDTTLVTIQFSKPVTGVGMSDLEEANGVLSELTSLNNSLTYTAVFTPNVNVEDASNVIGLGGIIDAAGNTGSGTVYSANYIIDTAPPVARTQNITVQLDATGSASITAADLDNGSSDLFGIATLSLDQTDFDSSHIGSNTVTLTVTDFNGNTATGTAIVTVEAPVVITGITFEDASFPYDGSVKSLIISGTLPVGTSVNYTNNGRIDVGTQEVTATITGHNYVPLVLTANLNITKGTQIITWTQDLNFGGCDNITEIALTATASSGLPVAYTVANTDIAEIINNVLYIKQAGNVKITVSQAGNTYYNAEVMEREVIISEQGLVRQHWDDVLIFDNSSANIVSYQWYKNGVAILGATKQYYSGGGVLDGTYHAEGTTESGVIITSCPLNIIVTAFSRKMTLFPNPVSSGQKFTVKLDFDPSELQGAIITVYDTSGRILNTAPVIDSEVELSAPNQNGIYIIYLNLADGNYKTSNLLVK